MENVLWQPPILSFTIERHGAAVMGSSRDELQRWKIDVAEGTATWEEAGYRQNRPTRPRLNVMPIAEEVAALIESGQRDERLQWYEDGRVRVLIGKIVQDRSAAKATVAGRRKRFRAAVKKLLAGCGWQECGVNVYEQ